MNLSTTGWNALSEAQPIDPLSVIASCAIGGTSGVWERSATILQSSWGTNNVAFTGNNTTVTSLDTTDATTTVAAAHWVTATKMVNVGAGVNSTVSKIAFVHAGPYMDNQIEIAFGATSWTNVQLSFRDNLGTSGFYTGGTVPAFLFTGAITGNQVLHLTIPNPGTYSLVLVMDASGTWSTFEMEIVAL